MGSEGAAGSKVPPLTPLAAATPHVAPEPERVLHVGCGAGDAVLFLAREFPRARIRGVDSSADAIRAAVARVGLDPEGRVAFRHAEGRRLPYPDNQFDLVVQDVAGPRLGEIARVMRPNGYLILARHDRPGGRWPHRRLRRHGFEVVRSGEAGDGAFCVSRQTGGGRRAHRE